MVRKAGGVCIADEVQTGFGKTGSKYWGFETQGVIPDIVTMAKEIGNGLPLGAVVTTPEIASVLAQKIQFNTYGGNPVCSAGGLAVLRVIDKEKRQQHCSDVGTRRHSPFAGHPPFNFVMGKGILVIISDSRKLSFLRFCNEMHRFFPVTHVQLSIPGNSRHQIGRMLAVDALLGVVLGLCFCVSVLQGVLVFVFIVLLAGSVSVRACREFMSLSGPVGSF